MHVPFTDSIRLKVKTYDMFVLNRPLFATKQTLVRR